MQFTPSIAISIMAFAFSALAAPAPYDYTPHRMTTAATGWSATGTGTGFSYSTHLSASYKSSNYSRSLTTYSTTYTATSLAITPPCSTDCSTRQSSSTSSTYESRYTYSTSESSYTYSTYQSSYSTAAPCSSYTTSISPPPQQTTIPAPPASTPNLSSLTKTQQLFLADTAVDRFALLSDSDLKFDFNDPLGLQIQANKGHDGRVIKADRKTFPALVSTGAGMAVGFLGPCGFNTPHLHPRSVELQIVTKGELVVEMLPENGVLGADGKRRVVHNHVTENQMTPFYMGSVHTQYNPTCYDATFVAAFNNEDFGAGSVADELFALDSDIVTAAFGEAISGADVEKFKAAIPASIAFGVEQCLQRCNLKKNTY